MARIFISYRRSDSKWAVGRIYDRLGEVLDKNNLFLDISDIEPGEDYVDKIEKVVSSCDVLLVVIGHDWLDAKDSLGGRRLDDPNDLVRVEIATALNRGVRVIPILIDDVEMPSPSAVPDELTSLLRRNAKPVSFAQFHSDIDSLIRVLKKVLSVADAATAESIPKADGDKLKKDVFYTELPLSICLETKGNIATALIHKGASLPAEAGEVFSTAEDNQDTVDLKLYWGEGAMVKDNLSLGTFKLSGIAPAPAGEPQIEVTVTVDENLIMTVTAKDIERGSMEVLDAVDLTRVEIPEDMTLNVPESEDSKRDPSDVFRDIFGGSSASIFDNMFGGVASTPDPDIHIPVEISADEAAAGIEKEIEFEQKDRCEDCNGKGGSGSTHPCKNCNGNGKVREKQGFFEVEKSCPQCKGSGEIYSSPCAKCGGGKYKQATRKVKVAIPAGISPNAKLRLSGQGNKLNDKRGDVYLEIAVQ
ncbi:MAG: Hsp70 family protein [Verrucomicrobiales bacterium]|nr:Hsp70 family protein [Verrucomicrobiales bacterium]